MAGLFVAVEGVDGAGKNTLVTALRRQAEAEGRAVYHVAFPRYGTLHADLAADALRGRLGPYVDEVYGMAMLFALDRRLAADGIRGALADGALVLADRWTASNAAYSCARLAEDPAASARDGVVSWVGDLEYGRLGLPRPDLTLFLATPADLARRRAEARESADATRTRDAYEHDRGLQERTSAAYRGLADLGWEGRWAVVAPDVDPAGLAAEVLRPGGRSGDTPTGGPDNDGRWWEHEGHEPQDSRGRRRPRVGGDADARSRG